VLLATATCWWQVETNTCCIWEHVIRRIGVFGDWLGAVLTKCIEVYHLSLAVCPGLITLGLRSYSCQVSDCQSIIVHMDPTAFSPASIPIDCGNYLQNTCYNKTRSVSIMPICDFIYAKASQVTSSMLRKHIFPRLLLPFVQFYAESLLNPDPSDRLLSSSYDCQLR
jgi:hypothetical protein